MNAKEFAVLLNGRSYGNELTKAEEAQARESGLVVVFGYSDDNMELCGAIHDEIGCYGGGTAYLTSAGLLCNDCGEDECPYFKQLKKDAATIEAVWNKYGYSWIYETNIPHESFDILEDGDTYCRGIVFALSDVTLPIGLSREDAIESLWDLVKQAEQEERRHTPDFLRWPDVDALIEHIEKHGFPTPNDKLKVAKAS